MVSTSIKVENQLNQIQVISNASSKDFQQFSKDIFKVGRETSTSFDQASAAALEFARQGLSLNGQLKRTKDAMTLVKVSGVDVDKAVSSITAALNTFNSELKDSTDLIDRLNIIGVDSVTESIELIEKGENPTPQSDSGVSYAPKFTKSDGEINWSDSAVSIFNRFRALSENPGVFTQYQGQKIRINQLATGNFDSYSLRPGKFVVKEADLIIGTSDGCLSISKLTPEGRKVMSGSDFYNGLTNKQVDFFG